MLLTGTDRADPVGLVAEPPVPELLLELVHLGAPPCVVLAKLPREEGTPCSPLGFLSPLKRLYFLGCPTYEVYTNPKRGRV